MAAGHDTLAKLMYARMLPVGGGPTAGHARGRADYDGGTAIDVALAVIVMTQGTSPPAGPGPDPAAISRRRIAMPRWRWVGRS